MTYSTRKIDYHELSIELKRLEKCGVEVPVLNHSNYITEYSHIEGNVEFYRHNGEVIPVRSGEFIDTYGNVVNLEQLQNHSLIFPVHNLEELVSV